MILAESHVAGVLDAPYVNPPAVPSSAFATEAKYAID
jgi:hypothetical protein